MSDTARKKKAKRTGKTIRLHGIAVRETRPGYYMVDLFRAGRRERACFDSIAEATIWCRNKATEVANFGLSSFDLSPKQRVDAGEALAMLKDRATLVAAARLWLERNPDAAGEDFKRTAVRYLRQMRKDGARACSIADKRHRLRRLLRSPGWWQRKTGAIDRVDLEKWADGEGLTGTNAKKYVDAYTHVLNFSAGRRKARARRDRPLPVTFTVDRVAQCMRVAETHTPELVPWLVVGFLCGVRPDEGLRLRWEMVHLKNGFLDITPEITKTGLQRHVTIASNAKTWLLKYAKDSGPIIANRSLMLARRDTLKEKLNLPKWPHDVTRHTWATLHYAEHDNAPLTAKEMGHFGSLEVFKRHYKGMAVSKAQSAKYWNIRPAKSKNNVIEFRAA